MKGETGNYVVGSDFGGMEMADGLEKVSPETTLIIRP
jgi:hypothetical protein